MGMNRDDVDLVNGALTIRDTKFGKSRYVPLHPSTQRALQRYAARRDWWCHDVQTPKPNATPMPESVESTLQELSPLRGNVRLRVKQLSTPDFTDTAQIAVLIGGPGTGKTHRATAIGVAGIAAKGKRVRFYSTVGLVNKLEKEKREGTRRSRLD